MGLKFSLEQPWERIGSAVVDVGLAVVTVDMPSIPGWGSPTPANQYAIPRWIVLEVDFDPGTTVPTQIYWAWNQDPAVATLGAVDYGGPCHTVGVHQAPVWIPALRTRNLANGALAELRLLAGAAGPYTVSINLVRLHPQDTYK